MEVKLEMIKELREDSDTKQETLAALLNVRQTTYSKYELGKINIPIESLMKLADFYSTSIDYIVGRTDCKQPYPKKKKNDKKPGALQYSRFDLKRAENEAE